VLFSEPKIPQSNTSVVSIANAQGFSALQRAENSSIVAAVRLATQRDRFSALQRAENSSMYPTTIIPQSVVDGFSALQRAENSSM